MRTLSDLTRGELDPLRAALRGDGVYDRAALVMPAWEEARTNVPAPVRSHLSRQWVHAADTDALHAAAVFFAALHTGHGGGYARLALTAHLAYDVSRALSLPAAGTVYRQMLTAAARLAILAGNMCADDGRPPLAQRYHHTAARLAAAAGDADTYAIALRTLADHADQLGHYTQAGALAERAAATARHHAPLTTCAYTLAQLAVTHARAHNRSQAMAALQQAERHHARADHQSGPFTAYPESALHYQRGRALTALNDLTGAAEAYRLSLRTRPLTASRSHVLTRARLAETLLRRGHLEAALEHWHIFLNDKPAVHSTRSDQLLTTMHQLLRPYRNHPATARLLDQAASRS
ncbi:hypothetical protein [Streptomyces chartreusis]|uniref:hypothetical protein n=1 Tax=Streptomyces chartreusis TaxID=1969 RepID=UPI002E1801A3